MQNDNDNFPVRPRPATPRSMIDWANKIIALQEYQLKENDINISKIMRCQNQIIACRKLKITALELMTSGSKPNQAVAP